MWKKLNDNFRMKWLSAYLVLSLIPFILCLFDREVWYIAILMSAFILLYGFVVTRKQPPVIEEQYDEEETVSEFNLFATTKRSYNEGNFIYDLKKLVEMFNSAKTSKDYMKCKAHLDTMTDNWDNSNLQGTKYNHMRYAMMMSIIHFFGMVSYYNTSKFITAYDYCSPFEMDLYSLANGEVIGINLILQLGDSKISRKLQPMLANLGKREKYKRSIVIHKYKHEKEYRKRLGRTS